MHKINFKFYTTITEITRILLLTFLFKFLILLGYPNIDILTLLFALTIFFFSLFIPLETIKQLSKNEIEYNFILWHNKKLLEEINLTKLFDLKSFPTWFFLSLLLSSLTLFKIPFICIGSIKYEGRKIKFKEVNKKNSELKIIGSHLFLFYIIIFFIAIVLMFYGQPLAIIPILINLSLILPIPGNLGYDLFILNWKKWLTVVKLIIFSLIFYVFFFGTLFLINT